MPQCFSCAKEITVSGVVGFREECAHCGADVRACKNCEFFDKSAYNECRETQADRILEKERSNRCDFFKIKTNQQNAISEKEKQRALAESLFKKKS